MELSASPSAERHPWVLSAPGVTALCAAVGLGALAVMGALGVHDRSHALDHPLTLVVVLLLLAYTHIRPSRLMHRHGSVDSDHLDEALFVPMVLMLNGIEVAIAVTAASLAGNLAAKRAPVKIVFNVGQTVLACLAGYAVAHAGGAGSDEAITTGVVLTCCLGGIVFAAVSSAAVAIIVRLASGHPLFLGLWEQWRTRGIASLGALLLGLVAGVAAHDHPVTALPAIAAGWSVERAYVAVVVQRQARLAAEALREGVVAVRNSSDPEAVGALLLQTAAQVLHAGTAELVSADTPLGGGALRAPVDDQTSLEVGERVGGGAWLPSEQDALNTLATVGGEALQNARLLAQLTAVTDGQSEIVLAMDPHGTITFANPAARRMLGHGGELVGQHADAVFSIERASGGRLDLTALAGSHSSIRDDDAVLRSDDERTPVAFTAAGLAPPERGVVLVLHDITERKAFEEQLTYLAFHDPLTDLPNRRLFEDRLDHALVRARRYGTRHAVLIVDLDRFKLVNDSYGHPVGDELLVHVAGLLRNSLRPLDTCARVGGDEFAILLEDIDDVAEAAAVAEKILTTLAGGCVLRGREVFVSASIGIATTDQTHTRASLVAAADSAGYAAKSTGRGHFQIFSPDSAADPRERLELESAMRHALENSQFELHYQPIVDTTTRQTVGAEALVRWRTADGLVPPYKFIPLAEETGLIAPLGAWVLEEACRQVQGWTSARPEREPLRISVNLSVHQLNRPKIVREVQDILARTGLAAEQLCLEITETVIMNDSDTVVRNLQALKALGVHVAIDDFGTGYSSLSYLKRFPLDVVKIDRAFTAGITTSRIDTEIASAVVRLAAARGVDAVAEGVETEEQREALRQIGCPLIQGYLISRPLPAADFEAFWDAAQVPRTRVGA